MTIVQVWMLVGVPVLVIGLALYTARSRWLGALGVLVVLAGAIAVAVVDRASGAALGVVAVFMYAAGTAGEGAVVGDDPVQPRPHDATRT